MKHGLISADSTYIHLIKLKNLRLLGQTLLLAQTIKDQLNAALTNHSLFVIRLKSRNQKLKITILYRF